MAAGPRCRCRIPNLALLRDALELSQTELAHTLDVTPRYIRLMESASPHRCLGPRTVANLRLALTDPHFRSLLKENDYPNPYPEDLRNAWFPGVAVGPRCHVDGIPLKIHARCNGCGSLAGPGHAIDRLDNTRLCPGCRAAISEGQRTVTRGLKTVIR